MSNAPNPNSVTIEPGFQTVFKLRAVPNATVTLTPPAGALEGKQPKVTLEGTAENLDGDIPCRLTVLVRNPRGYRRFPYAGVDSFSVSGEAFSLDLTLDAYAMQMFGEGKVGFELTPAFPRCKPAVLDPVLEFNNPLEVSLGTPGDDLKIGTSVNLKLEAGGAFSDAHVRLKLFESDAGEVANPDGFTKQVWWRSSDRADKVWRIGCANARGPAIFDYQDNEQDGEHEFGYVLEVSPDGATWSTVLTVEQLVKVPRPTLEQFDIEERGANLSANYVASWLGNVFLRRDEKDTRLIQIWVSGALSGFDPKLEVPLTVALFARKEDGTAVPFRDRSLTFTVEGDHTFEHELVDFTDLSYGEDLTELAAESGLYLFAALHSPGLAADDLLSSILSIDEGKFPQVRIGEGVSGRWANAFQTTQRPALPDPVSCGCWLGVPMGQLTFDVEGNDDASSSYYSRKPHCPSSGSGVTIGRGYDMKSRGSWRNGTFNPQPEKVEADLKWAGVDDDTAKSLSNGTGKEGSDASSFCSSNSGLVLDRLQQWKLFGLEYNRHLQDVKRISKGEDCVAAYGAVDFGALDWRIMVILVDLRYRGDYKTESRQKLQKHVADNDFAAFRTAFKANGAVVGSAAVPARHEARVKFLDDHQAYPKSEDVPASKRRCAFCNKDRGPFPTEWRTDAFDTTWAMRQPPPEGIVPWTPKTRAASTEVGTVGRMVDRGGEKVPHFSQGNSAWANTTMGVNRTIKAKGCAMTSVAMCLKFYGRDVDPGTLDTHLDNNDGWSGDCVIWDTAFQFGETGSPYRLRYANETDSSKFEATLNERIAADKPTIAQVDYLDDADEAGNHFVVIVGKTSDGKWIMNDPATSAGNGAADLTNNVLETTDRHGGYKLIRIIPFTVTDQ